MNTLPRLTQPLVLWVLLAIALFPMGAHSTQEDLDAEIANYVDIFANQGQAQQRKAIETLSWSGHSEPELFDVIEAGLLDGYMTEDKYEAERMSWLAKALALSGNPKYRETLQKVYDTAPSKKLRRHTETALERLTIYEAWNPVIAQGLAEAPAGKLEETRIENMLASGVPELVRLGAKRIYNGHSSDSELLELAKERLLADYPTAQSKVEVDAVAWLCKALAQSGQSIYRPVLEEVANKAPNAKVAKYANKYAQTL